MTYDEFTGTQISTLAARELVDTDDGAYTDDMLDYINEAIIKVSSETHCCQDIYIASDSDIGDTLSLSTIEADSTEVRQILVVPKILYKVNNGTDNMYRNVAKDQFEANHDYDLSNAIPTRYRLFARKLMFDANINFEADGYTSDQLHVFYSYIPSAISALSNYIQMPVIAKNAIAKYVVYQCRLADRDAGLANGAFEEYEIMRSEILHDVIGGVTV